jgi:hypothetical protein
MRNWEALVRGQLGGLSLDPGERGDVIAELAGHLEEACDGFLRQGMSEEEAVRRTLAQAGSWDDLKSKILVSKRKEQIMEQRVRQLWIPGFLSLILSMLFLVILQKQGLQAHLVWSGPNAILLYPTWLLSLPFFGALSGFVSSRAGGSRRTALLASVFPSIALTAAFLLMFPIGLTVQGITGRRVDFSQVATAILKDGIGWIVLPTAALLLGGLVVHALMSTRPSPRSMAIGS